MSLSSLRAYVSGSSSEALLFRQVEQYVFAGMETRSLEPGTALDLMSRPSQPMARASANAFNVVSSCLLTQRRTRKRHMRFCMVSAGGKASLWPDPAAHVC